MQPSALVHTLCQLPPPLFRKKGTLLTWECFKGVEPLFISTIKLRNTSKRRQENRAMSLPLEQNYDQYFHYFCPLQALEAASLPRTTHSERHQRLQWDAHSDRRPYVALRPRHPLAVSKCFFHCACRVIFPVFGPLVLPFGQYFGCCRPPRSPEWCFLPCHPLHTYVLCLSWCPFSLFAHQFVRLLLFLKRSVLRRRCFH